ncbi:MAG: asparagine synthase (glutamine-hydrolyzing) [Acidimicrobiales bacterium]
MCGIAGLVEPGGNSPPEALLAIAGRMAGSMAHRGPDDAGSWCDPGHGVALGFRRLAIVDLSPTGHQPMVSPSGRYVVVFNGEVYDHRRLRVELERRHVRFRGRSDTEVLLARVDDLGVEVALKSANLMCGLAIWDRSDAVLTLARDRLGEKPLMWGWAGSAFVFGSELKALRAHGCLSPDLDGAAVAAYLRLGYVPHPQSIVRDARQLPPGTLLRVTPSDVRARREPVPHRWWSLDEVVRQGAHRRRGAFDHRAAVEEVSDLLQDSVMLRREADVPVGAFLSGGVDSSAVVAALQATGTDTRTFCIAMPEAGLDESASAAAVARHLGTDHTTIELSVGDALAVVPQLPTMFDEPFADPSALPTHLVSAAARREVTVALTGDGGDEVFGGYNRHLHGPATWRRVGRFPPSVRGAAATALERVSPDRWDALGRTLPGRERVANPGDKVGKLAALLRASDGLDASRRLLTIWEPAEVMTPGRSVAERPSAFDQPLPPGLDDVERLLFVDTVQGLPDGMLTKVDRASMACSLEVRAPLLDHRIVEQVWQLPRVARIDRGRGKLLLRDVLSRHVPSHLVERPKLGFDPPIGPWLRGPLRLWADELLAPDRLAATGWIDPGPVQQRWREHLDGTRRWDYALWSVLCFTGWHESWTT